MGKSEIVRLATLKCFCRVGLAIACTVSTACASARGGEGRGLRIVGFKAVNPYWGSRLGCGETNIADWVQSISISRRPSGIADVTVTFAASLPEVFETFRKSDIYLESADIFSVYLPGDRGTLLKRDDPFPKTLTFTANAKQLAELVQDFISTLSSRRNAATEDGPKEESSARR